VLLVLFVGSFFSWAIIIEKFFSIRKLNKRTKEFENEFWTGQDLISLYDKAQTKNNHPLAIIFVNAINEWQLRDNMNLSDTAKERLKERVYQSMMVSKSRALTKIEKNLNYLAIISSSAPFIGLFGTVWGIMNSFAAIASSQDTSLAVVAPGISEALFATAIGLFTAIPALVAYNVFASKLGSFSTRAEDFCVEVLNLLSRELDK
jgi:biopolymer transport protein TolQ